MSTGNQYTDEQLIIKLEAHCIDEHLSKYTVAYPTWKTYRDRMKKSSELEVKVHNLLALSDQWWERQAIAALHDKDYNNMMWTKMTSNKAFTKDHSDAEILERLERLEDAKHTQS